MWGLSRKFPKQAMSAKTGKGVNGVIFFLVVGAHLLPSYERRLGSKLGWIILIPLLLYKQLMLHKLILLLKGVPG